MVIVFGILGVFVALCNLLLARSFFFVGGGAMGSMDWAECVYCEYYVRDPYLHDGIGLFGYGALCGWCVSHLDSGGQPMDGSHWWLSTPSSIDLVSRGLVERKLMPMVIRQTVIASMVARFLILAGKENDINVRIRIFGFYI
jgi:hypothetical protein